MSPAIWRSLSLFIRGAWFLSERRSEGTKNRESETESRGTRLQLERGVAQQLEQQQQLQRARAAPWDPAEPVEVSAKCASMPTRTAGHTFTVNSTPRKWDMFHLIRSISLMKGLFTRLPGHMAHNRAHGSRLRTTSTGAHGTSSN